MISAKNALVFFASTFSVLSTSYVDFLDGSGGSVISVTLTKGSNTDVLIRAGAAGIANSVTALTATLGVNDGTTDYDLARSHGNQSSYFTLAGMRVITGLPAGTYTFKLRVKSTGNTALFNGNVSACLTAIELDNRAINAKSVNYQYSSNFTSTSSSYTDLLRSTGGSTIAVTITKGAGDLLVFGDCGCRANTTNETALLGVNDGTTDYNLARCRLFTTSQPTLFGSTIITGLPAGTYTLKLRIRGGGTNQIRFISGSSWASLLVMEIAP